MTSTTPAALLAALATLAAGCASSQLDSGPGRPGACRFGPLIERVASETQVDPGLIAGVAAVESRWNPRAKNPSSTAFGLFQFLKSTWATYCKEGSYGSTDPYVQALGGFRYIKSRYRTPEGAWAFWQRHHWY